jgi:hypothetical protein
MTEPQRPGPFGLPLNLLAAVSLSIVGIGVLLWMLAMWG